ncbi:MAG TPA: MFS transporter [Actinomycetota bacterium]|nr:MFS transporter [Actinomycetota bacterium]
MTAPRAAVRRLAAGRLISIGGSAAAYTALMFTVYERTGSAVWLSAALLATEGVTGLLGPLAGALGDRFDRQRVMVASDLGAALCFAAMAVADSPGALIAFAFASAVLESPFWPASGAAIPNLVPPDQISWANSLISVGRNVGVTIGPAVGGGLLALVGPSWVFGANATSFVVSAALILSVRASFAERSGGSERSDLRAGFRFLVDEPVLRRLGVAWVVFILGVGMVMVADVPLAELFDAGSVGYGFMIALWGAGSVLGSLAGRWLTPRTEMRWLVLATVFVAGTGFAIAASPWFWLVLAMNLAWGLGDGVTVVADQNIMQRRTPDALRGRVMGAFEGAIHGTMAISYIVAGVVVPAVGARGVYAIGGVAALLAVAVLSPLVRIEPSVEVDAGPASVGLRVPGAPPGA